MEMKTSADKVFTFDLDWVERDDIKGWKTFELGITESSDSRGATSATAYSLQPVNWIKQAMQAAKERMIFQPIARQEVLPYGVSQLVIPRQTIQQASWETSSAEYTTANTDMTFTTINNKDGVFFEPDDESYGVAATNKSLRKNALNLVQEYQNDLEYRMSHVIDGKIRDAITPASGGVAEMTDTVRGVQTIFGGDATDLADSVDDGDVMTPALIKKAKRLLMSKAGFYWSGNTWTQATAAKNPWMPDSGGPFYGLISVEAEEQLLNSSQFTNAAEFGKDTAIQTGEIMKYVGVNMATSTLVNGIAAGGDVYVTAGNRSQDVPVHENLFVKANYAGGLVWGQKPKMHVFDYPSQLQKRIVIEMAYEAKAIYPDAIVRVVTSDD